MEMSIETRNDFIESNMGLIGKHVKPYAEVAKEYGYEYNDLFNSGVIGMIEGIENYSLEKATRADGSIVPLNAFVNWDIRRVISEFIAKPRKHDRLENKVSMQKPTSAHTGDSTGGLTTVGDMIADETIKQPFDCGMNEGRLKTVLESDLLSKHEKIAVVSRFIDDLKFREIDVLVQESTGNPKAKSFHYINTGMKKLQNALATSA